MVDFAAIRSHHGSQNNGFEELVVQLARRRPPLDAHEFRRIEGAGGDAGVEALWLRTDGSAVGVQAKYFLRVRDIDWVQIDKSVAATLKHRPEVNVYQIAIACDLTDRGGAKGVGRSGWAAWDDRVKRWEADAQRLGRKVLFEPITASDLVDWLGQPNAAGLARYWFGEDILGLPWFANQVRIASFDLGERYTPDHHVVVGASPAFDGLARSATLRSRMQEAVEATWKHSLRSSSVLLSDDAQEALERAEQSLKRVHAITEQVGAPVTTTWNVREWLSDIGMAEQLLGRLEEELRKDEIAALENGERPRSTPDSHSHRKGSIRKIDEALSDLGRLLRSVAFRADDSRVLLVTGEAGTGKSHLLAAEANRALAESRPALLFLGQQFAQGSPWDQCERSLGLPGWPRAEFLGALNAAGEAAGCRSLVLVDAVNEGAGANLWRNHLAGFIESLAAYPHIAVVIACRSEYVPFAIPKPILDAYPIISLHGFTTFEEQEAAAVAYLDRRGIVRPAGPLLAPEFSHPLFLKAASDALLKKHVFAFPRGLRGALNILGFYLDSVGSNLLPASAEPADLAPQLRRALAGLAQEMALTKSDFVPNGRAELIVSQSFSPRSPPPGLTWLEVLLRNGIVRLDPDPMATGSESFVISEDVARIAFQRFQDHLIVQASLAGASEAPKLFMTGGPLEWLVCSSNHNSWTGLFEALSIQIPETFDMELVDALPGGAERWWFEWGIQEGFIQSVRWRGIKSRSGQVTFTDRSLALFNSISQPERSTLGLLLEVAAVPEHPWNANLLHRNLWRWGLNQRDLRWSREIAFAADDNEHPVHRLLNWTTGGKLDHAEPEMLQLIAITLTWLCSSTSRYIRDVATRGLCRLLRVAPSIHRDLLTIMIEVDDLYVLERLLAASYGAACQSVDETTLETIAASTFQLVFNKGIPPQHLLARDYALGILELAQARGRLPAVVDMAKARPPFASKALRAPSQVALEKRKDKVGDHSIIWSCGEHGDFGRYEIASSVGDFSATKLNAAPPLSRRNIFDLFVTEVASTSRARKAAFYELEEASRKIWRIHFDGSRDSVRLSRTRSQAAVRAASEIEAAFLALLTDEEQTRYARDAFSTLFAIGRDREPLTFDRGWAQRWVASRAYSLGWTKERFGDDRTPSDRDRQRARIERVGKKYQWLALYELLAWLTDTHWVKGDWGSQPKRYCYPTDTSFQRDIDPTLAADVDVRASASGEWWKLSFDLRATSEENLTTWVKQDDPWHSARDSVFRVDAANEEWVTLDSFQRAVERFSDRNYVRRDVGIRREAFQFVHCLIVSLKDLHSTYKALVAERARDARPWGALEVTDGPYLGEYGWRATWPDSTWSSCTGLPGDIPALRPVVEYYWESHLDASRPEGARYRLPSQGLLGLMNLASPNPLSPDATTDQAGATVIVHHRGEEGGHSVTVRRDRLQTLLIEKRLGCIWFVSSERSAWPSGGQEDSTRRWFGSLIAFDGQKIKTFDWETPW